MREIKFRGKSNEGLWVYGDLVTRRLNNVFFIEYKDNGLHYLTPVNPDTVGEYTGLKDKNGKEIYEGDILYGVKPNKEGKWLVFWNEKEAEWSIKSSHGIKCGYHYKLSGLGKREVIGNVYENPELLEVNQC